LNLLAKYFLEKRRTSYFLAIISFTLALFAYEGSLVLPFYIILIGLTLNINIRKLFIDLSPFIFLSIIYLVLRRLFMPCDILNFSGILSPAIFKNLASYSMDYLQQFILPIGFQVDFFKNIFIFKLLLFIITFLFIIFFVSKAFISKDKKVIFGILFFLGGALAVIKLKNLIFYLGSIISEHYVYMASAGLCLLLACLVINLYRHFPAIAKICFLVFILFFSSLTIITNANYKDDLTFYNYVLKINKVNPLINLNLGVVYFKNGRYQEAFNQAYLALKSDPNSWDTYALLGNIFYAKREVDKAMQFYKKAISLNHHAAEVYNNLGIIYMLRHQKKEAYHNFAKAIASNPEYTLGLKNFADFLFQERAYRKSFSLYNKVLNLDKKDSEVYLKIGIILEKFNYFKEAELTLNKALQLKPNSVEVLNMLGVIYANQGNLRKGIKFWHKALLLQPANKEIEQNIEKADKLLKSRKLY
jgi:Flp pilus assembly protein TadD